MSGFQCSGEFHLDVFTCNSLMRHSRTIQMRIRQFSAMPTFPPTGDDQHLSNHIYIYVYNMGLLWVCLKNRLRFRPSSWGPPHSSLRAPAVAQPGRISDEGRAELDEDELTPAQVELDGELGLMVDGGRSMVDIHGCWIESAISINQSINHW